MLKKNGPQHLGRSHGGFTTKVHLICCGRGLPLAFLSTAGQQHDLAPAQTLLQLTHQQLTQAQTATTTTQTTNSRPLPRPRHLIADRAYDARSLRATLKQYRIRAYIPERKLAPDRKQRRRGRPTTCPPEVYKQRNQIERLFRKLKQNRRISSWFEKLAVLFHAMLQLACIQLYLRIKFSDTP